MSERDHQPHTQQHHHSYSTRTSGYNSNSSRESPSSRRPASYSNSHNSTSSHNGGGKGNMPAATIRNSVVLPPNSQEGFVSMLSDDLSHLNLTSEVMVGSTVQCSMAPNDCVYKGDVLAFDNKLKAIILKCPSTCNRGSLNDVHILNLSQMKELKILNENLNLPADPPNLNLQKLQNRLREQAERKRRLVMAFKAGVSPEGQKLFQTIGKTIDDIVWNGESIVVMKEVTITPPYRPDNVKGHADSKALKHIRKIVEKHISDQAILMRQHPTENAQPMRSNDNTHTNNNIKSESSTPTASSPALGARVNSPAAQHSVATRTGSTGQYSEDSSKNSGVSGGQRQQRISLGGGSRNSGGKRDYEPASSKYTQ